MDECFINKVIVDVDRYEELISHEEAFNQLIGLLLTTAQLSWDSKSLRYDDEIISAVLKTVASKSLKDRIDELKFELKEVSAHSTKE